MRGLKRAPAPRPGNLRFNDQPSFTTRRVPGTFFCFLIEAGFLRGVKINFEMYIIVLNIFVLPENNQLFFRVWQNKQSRAQGNHTLTPSRTGRETLTQPLLPSVAAYHQTNCLIISSAHCRAHTIDNVFLMI
jgi:hypothetical protein